MPTLAACLKKHVTYSSDRELVQDSFQELKETMPAPKASVQAVREALSAVEDERDTFLDNIEKKHNVVLQRPERMPAVPERVEEKPSEPEAKPVAKAEQAPKQIPSKAEAKPAEVTPEPALQKPEIDLQAAPVKALIPQGAEKPKLITVERAAEIAKRVYQREGIQSPIRILNNPYDLRTDMLDLLTEKYGGTLGRPQGMRDGRTVYVFVDNIKTEAGLEETIVHELLHVGNDRLFGSRLKRVMERLYDDLGGQEEIQKIADKYGVGWFVGQYRERLKAANWEIASELVSFVGMKPDDKSLPGRVRLAIKRAYGALRQLLREYGFLKTAAMNDAELSQFIKRTLDAARAPETGIEPIMTMQWGIEMESVELQDIALQLQDNQDNSNLYANRPSAEVNTVVQGIKDYIAGSRGKGIGSEVVEHYGFWDRFIGTVDNIAAKNPKSNMPQFFETAKRMRMDQDETFALTNVAVTAFNRLKGPQQARLKKALIEGTLQPTKTGMGKEWNRDTLKSRFGLDRDGMQSYDDIRAYLDEIKDRHRDRLLDRVGVRQGKYGLEVIGQEGVTEDDRAAAITLLEDMIKDEKDDAKREGLREKVRDHKRDAKRIELGNRIIRDFDELKGYFPLMRFGDYTIAVRKPLVEGEEVGELVHFEQAESKTEMRRKAGRLRRLYPASHSVDTGQLERFTGESMINDPRLMSMLRDYTEMAGEGIEIVDAVEQEMLKRFAEQSFKKRMIHRKGIPGYDENINRVLASYGWSASNYLSKLKFIPKLQEIYEDTSKHEYPEIREHMGKQIQYMRGGAEGAAGEEFSWFKSMTFAMYMGLNVKSAAVNLTQVPMVLYPYLAGKYSDARAIASITKAQKAAARPKKTGDPVLDKLMAWAEKEGLTMDMYLSDLMGMARGKRLAQARLQSKAVSGLSFMFSHAERFNRRVSAAAEFYANPNRSYEELQKAMEKTIRTTQFDYGKHNRGRIFQGWTSMPMQFHQFTVNYLQFLNPKKHGWGTTMRAMGMLWLAAGVMATPGIDDLRAFIEFMAQKAFGTHIDLEMWARKAIVDNAREYFGSETAKTIAESVLRGQGAYLAGDIAGSLSNSRLIPGFSRMLDVAGYRGLKEGLEAGILDAAGAGPGFIANSLRGVEDALKTGDIRRAAERGPVPVAVQNFLKAVRTGTEGVDRDVSGRVQIAYSPTLVDSILQGMSIQPSERSRLYRIKNRQMRESAFVKGQHSEMLTRLAVGYAERDLRKIRQARADIATWNRVMPRQWRLKADKVKRSIKARRRRFDISATTGMDPILKQLRPSLRAEQAQYYQ